MIRGRDLTKSLTPFLVIGGLLAVGCGKSGDGDTLAIVNGVSIPMRDYYQTMERKDVVTAFVNPSTMSVDRGNGQLAPQVTVVRLQPAMAFQALQECIANEVIRQVAKDEGVYPTDEDLQQEIKLQEEAKPNFVKEASENGLTIDQIKNALAMQLVRHNLQAKGAKPPTDEEINDYIKANPAQFTEPARAALLYIEAVDDKTKTLAEKELKEGNMFAAVASRYSVAPDAKAKGYRYPTEVVPQMPVALQKLVEKTKENTMTSWNKDDRTGHWVIFYVQRKAKPKPAQLNHYFRTMLSRQLQARKGVRSNDPDKRIAEKLKASKIEIKIKYLEEPWKKAFEELTKPKEPGQ
ncbi:MAG TPA: peptidyl-prolyl cis-trans isomerase [Fimbriimonadaceae bacterium]|nr:peptidyl-prolyl cis-trans isomerase [Fimbriimonadaceae bacterium]